MGTLRIACHILILTCIVYQSSYSQDQSLNGTLTQLRGTWEYHTYYKRWKITFLSGGKMILNNRDATYKLTTNTIQISNDGTEIVYNYAIDGELLSLSDREGRTTVYKYWIPGKYEQAVDGVFYNKMDKTQASFLAFNEGRSFSYRDTAEVVFNGIYRVEDNLIVLVFDNGDLENVTIRYRDENGVPDGIVLQGQIFSKEIPVTIVDYLPRPNPYIPPPPCYPDPCPPPPCFDCVNPPPPPEPPAPVLPPSQHVDPPPQPVHHGDRVIGTTRGDEMPGVAGPSPRAGGDRRP